MTTVGLLAYVTVSWLNPSIMQCFNSFFSKNYRENTINVYSNEDISLVLGKGEKMAYTYDGRDRSDSRCKESLIIFKKLSNLETRNINGRVTVVTESTGLVSKFWTESRISDLVVLVPHLTTLKAYTWFPYHTTDSNSSIPKVEYLTTCTNGSWHGSIPKFSEKIPKNFNSYPFHIIPGYCVGMLFYENVGDYIGVEHFIYKTITDYYRMRIVYNDLPPDVNFYRFRKENGEPTGILQLLYEQKSDIAIGCLGFSWQIWEVVDFLPPHVFESISWFVPSPRVLPNYSNLYSGFSMTLWWTIFASFVLFVGILALTGTVVKNKYKSISYSFINTLQGLLGSSTKFESGLIQVLLSLLYIFSMHILTFYQSSLLYFLFRITFEKPITTPWEGLDAGLTPLFRGSHSQYLQFPDDTLMQRIASGKHIISETVYINYKNLVNNRDSMFLGLKYIDEICVRGNFPDYPFKELMQILEPAYQTYPFVILMSPGNPLFDLWGRKILQLQEGGMINRWQEVLAARFSNLGKTMLPDKKRAITLNAMKPAIYVLAFGLAGSLVVFILETRDLFT